MAERRGFFGRPPFPEGNVIPPQRGGSRFGISAPPVITPERPTTPTLPRPDTAQPAPEQRPVKPEKDHTGRNIVLVTTGLGVLGAGAYAAYETIPAVHERVDFFLNSFTDNRIVPRTEAETNKVNPEEVSDNTAEKLPPLIEKDSVNIPIRIKTKDGKSKTVTHRVMNRPVQIMEAESVFVQKTVLIWGDIEPGDIFESPIISGEVYRPYKNPRLVIKGKNEDGINVEINIVTGSLLPKLLKDITYDEQGGIIKIDGGGPLFEFIEPPKGPLTNFLPEKADIAIAVISELKRSEVKPDARGLYKGGVKNINILP